MLRFGAQPLGKHRCLADRQLGIDHNVGFGVQPVTDPSGAHRPIAAMPGTCSAAWRSSA